MTKPMPTLDLDAPIASLRAHTPPTDEELEARRRNAPPTEGITQTELANRRGVKRHSVIRSEKQGENVSIHVLRAYADAAGWDLRIELTPKRTRRG